MEKSTQVQNVAADGAFLGIDFGQAKIGLALADGETKMAFAFGILKNDQDFFGKLEKLIVEKNIQLVVLGMTGHGKDQEGKKIKEEFSNLLSQKLGIKIAYQEEMFTTKMALENLRLRGKKNVSKNDDAEAARIILQSWLDKGLF